MYRRKHLAAAKCFDDWYAKSAAGIPSLQMKGSRILPAPPRMESSAHGPAPKPRRAQIRVASTIINGISDAALAESGWPIAYNPGDDCCFKNRHPLLFYGAHGLLYAKPRPRNRLRPCLFPSALSSSAVTWNRPPVGQDNGYRILSLYF